MGTKGGLILSEKLKELERALGEYYGAINEIKMKIRAKMPPKPEALVTYEKCKALGIPLVEGGVMNQPYIWLQELAVVIDQETLFDLIEKRQQEEERMRSQEQGRHHERGSYTRS